MNMFPDQRETRPHDQRVADQLVRLNEHLAHARATSSTMAKRLADAPSQLSCLEDLQSLPVLRKSELIELQATDPFGGLVGRPEDLAHIYRSPGPITDVDGHAGDWWRFGRALHAAGIGVGDRIQNCFAYHFTPAGLMFERAAIAIGASVFPAGPGQTEAQAEAMAALGITGYAGVPDFLKIILEKADEMGLDTSRVTKAVVSGGPLFPAVREWLQGRGINILQCYGTADLGLVAYESSPTSGLIMDEDVVVEILRPGTGEQLAPGEVGEVVVTPLTHKEYPLVRFATGDLSAVMEGQSPCGRTNVRLKGWMGRADQTTKVKGMFVHPIQVDRVVKEMGAVRGRLEVMRDGSNDKMLLKLEHAAPETGFVEEAGQSVQRHLKLKGGVEVLAPGSLPNDGKVIDDQRDFG